MQSFFAQLIEKNYWGDADQAKGRFRTFLLIAFKRFMSNEYKRLNRLKRGGGRLFTSLDSLDAEQRYALEPAERVSADRLYDRGWALTVLSRALTRLESEMSENAEAFRELKAFISAGNEQALSIKEAAAKLRMSEGAVKTAVHRLRKRYRVHLEAEIARTVGSTEMVRDERQCLLEAVSL